MFFLVSKILSFLFMPLTWAVLLLLASLIWKKKTKKFVLAATAVLLVFSNSFILHEVSLWWEHPITKDKDLEGHHIGIVLGGYAYYSPENDRVTFRQSTDRLMQAIRLVQMGKLDKLIISGGSGYVTMPDLKESIYVGEFLEQMMLSKGNFIIESSSRNTRENAVESFKILQQLKKDKQGVVLITSAYHMPRAVACFEKLGLQVIPFAAEPTTGERIFSIDHLLLPQAEVLSRWNVLIHEWAGYLSYKVLGYS